MKTAAVTEDESSISAHFGRAPFYLVLAVEEHRIVAREKRARAYYAPGEPHHHTGSTAQHQHGAMIDPIRDCTIVLPVGGVHQVCILMALAISMAVGCQGCIAYHTHDAIKTGATRHERQPLHDPATTSFALATPFSLRSA